LANDCDRPAAGSGDPSLKKTPTGELLGQVFGMRMGIKSQRENTLGELCEDSIAQSRREIGFRVTPHCTSCGTKGATIQRPGWAGNHIGFCPFPTD
jgi:hypothetical protein